MLKTIIAKSLQPAGKSSQWNFKPSNNPISKEFYAAATTVLADVTPANLVVKQHVGQTIFKFVVKLVGIAKAPKITGMLIDLSIPEMLEYLQHFDLFVSRINEAQELLAQADPAWSQ